jgi:amino-acid N-acetyltransferase
VAALGKAGLAVSDVGEEGSYFWRFTTQNDIPVGFGGFEVHGRDALLRSLVTLPPVRRRGVGRAMVAMLETEAAGRGCGAVWLLTDTAQDFFARLGYAVRPRVELPESIRAGAMFSRLCPASADAMVKRL